MSALAGQTDLSGRVVVITGGAGYLAGEIAQGFAEAGANVALADVAERPCEERAAGLSGLGSRAMALEVDVANEQSVVDMAGSAIAEFGHIDVLVNTAGRTFFKTPEALTLEEWDTTWQTNVTGTFLCSRTVGPHMVERGAGSIINFGSIYGIVAADQSIYGDSGWNSSPAYAASKAAIIHLTHYLAKYWGPRNVRVNSVSPGGVFNDQDAGFIQRYSAKTPMGRMADRTDVTGAVLFLASDGAAYVTGQNLAIDGGFSL